jgi:Fic family protein
MTGPVRYHLGQFPPDSALLDWARLVPLIGPANAALARYDGLIAAIPNARVLLSPLTTQEAVLSSKIEGTNVTMGEVLEIEAGADGDIDQPKRDDAEEVLNYRVALGFAANALRERPLSPHLLREAHALLLRGVRGRDKNPGAFRDEQNWIGPQGCTIDQASFVPIPQEHLQSGLDTWGAYLADGQQPDPLVQLAMIHLEFEALHPFKDGNGRLGRMIIPLFLMQRGVLSSPSFYMSGYLEARREEYIERMRAVSRTGAWTEWCLFFLQGLIEQAHKNQERAQQIIALNNRMQREVAERTHSQFAGLAVDFIFSRPVFPSPDFVENAGIPRESAQRLLRLLRDGDDPILRTIRQGSGRRPAVLAFPALLNIAEGRAVL